MNDILAKTDLVDVIRNSLILELKISDGQTKNIAEIASIIICNLTMARKREVRKAYALHPIWELAY